MNEQMGKKGRSFGWEVPSLSLGTGPPDGVQEKEVPDRLASPPSRYTLPLREF